MMRFLKQQVGQVLLGGLACLPLAVMAQEPVVGDYWAHDPSTMIKDGNRYYVYRTSDGIMGKWSMDKVNWYYAGQVFPSGPPAWTTAAVPGFSGFFWAPDIAYFNGKYHLYYSCSSWGSIDSAIGLVTTPSLISPAWADQGKVVQSDAISQAGPDTDTTSINCIDPGILVDTNGNVWMVYGSYSDGIMVTRIDPATGKRLNPASAGTKVASSTTTFFSNNTEASYLHQRGGYYYLFLNYGGCCSGIDSTYNIRVGRSASVTGPYLDRNGVAMLNGGGSLVLESTGRFIGPGHAGIMSEDGKDWFTYHYYDGANNGEATLGMACLHWTGDGWPVVTNDWSAFYTFEADAREHRGQYNGQMTGGATVMPEPNRASVLDLDGGASRVDLPISVANASTFAAWVKWNGGGDWQRIFDFGAGTGRYLFLTPRAFDTGAMRFAITTAGNGSNEQVIDAPMALPTNSWVHVAVTLEPGRGLLYLNGKPVGTNNNLTLRPWQVQARANYIGKSQWPDPLFDGRIDSFRVFARALNASEVRDLAWVHPALAHRYSFNQGAQDSIGTAHGTVFGTASVTNGALQLSGVSGAYVSLPGGLVSSSSAATFEFWATFGTNDSWVRVFEFGTTVGSGGSQFVFFSPRTSTDSHRFQMQTSAGSLQIDPPGPLDNQSVHVVCILDPTNHFAAVYTNGVLELSATAALPPLSSVASNLCYLGRSLFSSIGWLNGAIDEFRIYDGRLTSEEIAANFLAGPDALALPMTLEQSLTDANVKLQWPSYGAGFDVESTGPLPDGTWSPAAGSAVVSNGFYRLSQPVASGSRFHRLKR
jgi:hypothetical protein